MGNVVSLGLAALEKLCRDREREAEEILKLAFLPQEARIRAKLMTMETTGELLCLAKQKENGSITEDQLLTGYDAACRASIRRHVLDPVIEELKRRYPDVAPTVFELAFANPR